MKIKNLVHNGTVYQFRPDADGKANFDEPMYSIDVYKKENGQTIEVFTRVSYDKLPDWVKDPNTKYERV
tara:strand:- start:1162 stop:1368 length:207 start_codon:yes stop_codon:yes gene_type:complete